MRTTPLRMLADHALGGGLDQLVADRRAAGDSWRQISHALRDATNLDIAPETLRLWFKASEVAA